MRRGQGIYSIGANPQDLIRRVRAQNPGLADNLAELGLGWYRISNRTDDDDTAEILVYDVIGSWFGVEAGEFVRELNDITASNINVRINSPGGDVYDSIAIYNALMMHPANITVYVDSLAASGASVIAMAGDNVVMLPGSQMMIHDALMLTVGNAAELRADADFLDKQSQNIAGFYAAKAGGSPDEWRERMLAETWMMADEAVDMGLADEVYTKAKSTEDDDEEVTDAAGTRVTASTKTLMNFRHPLANRGFNYAGRKRAPAPVPVATATTKSLADLSVEEFNQRMIDQMLGSE